MKGRHGNPLPKETDMKLVILDGHGVNPGDMSWEPLERMVDLVVYDFTQPEDVVDRCKDAEMVLTNKVVFDASVLGQLPRLMYIGVLATGYNVVDLEVASRQSIVVTNIPSYSTDSVVQMVWAHLLNIVNMVGHYAEENRNGRWTASRDFCYMDAPVYELANKQMGIVGLGNIGMKMAKTALAFGMKVVALTSKSRDELPEGVKSVSLEELLSGSDVVTLHCPLNSSTKEMIDRDSLRLMRSSSILINTGRGGLVNEQDLADALNEGVIGAYGADVLCQEPASADNPLLTARNCHLTPHIAWATVEARQRLIDVCVENVKGFLNGKVINKVN